MMPQHTPAPANLRLCGYCDGFPVVAITTGTRNRDRSRRTLNVICPACQGTGHVPAAVLTTVREVTAA
jgi:hypothetical protein